ncbi:hypothetical protein Y1Q_0017680 [Alligator mississippiensis]|uniref:Uncharacterized protein n=1 Tax=Alligator mississippiensis TaxID=8496 RepID=A0A151MLP7_ALLMI|nr:hypothetical protein Y1Q_0017680 [Alligator mississippiensis]
MGQGGVRLAGSGDRREQAGRRGGACGLLAGRSNGWGMALLPGASSQLCDVTPRHCEAALRQVSSFKGPGRGAMSNDNSSGCGMKSDLMSVFGNQEEGVLVRLLLVSVQSSQHCMNTMLQKIIAVRKR